MAGISGYIPAMALATIAYIFDTTQPDSRAFRLGILEAIILCICGTAVNFSSGVWIKKYGYKPVYFGILTLHLLNLVYILVFLPESLPQELKKNTAVFSYENIKSLWMVYTKKRFGRWILVALLICAVIVYFGLFVMQTLLVLYVKRAPLCWDSSVIGYFWGAKLLSRAVGAVVGIKLCSSLGISNFGAIQMGVLSIVANLVMMGFSTITLEMFLGKSNWKSNIAWYSYYRQFYRVTGIKTKQHLLLEAII